jgi:DNA mismatch repair protein MutL
MPDLIRRLPESLANRIAAGEVVQRPASVVKELLENAVDAGADRISLAIRDGGTSLIMVGDNGVGMSNTDARLCFERHATSKIHEPDDLFRILTKGFRGEALASIAAVARVELKTRQHEDQVGTRVVYNGGHLEVHELCQTGPGTVISVKNLFFNTPARRKFLKSEAAESRLILEEFTRIALAHPEIQFEYINNDALQYNLPRSGQLERILALLGTELESRLLSVRESTDIVNVQGYVFKADFARKTRPEQYLFVNRRYVKHTFVTHAIESAYEGLIPAGHKPGFFLFLEVAPQDIDVNIHPSKTEIKFADERSVYFIVKSAVRQALGLHHMAPSLNFDEERAVTSVFRFLNSSEGRKEKPGTAASSSWKVPHDKASFEALYPELQNLRQGHDSSRTSALPTFIPSDGLEQGDTGGALRILIFKGRFLLGVASGKMFLLDYVRALERIFYERLSLETTLSAHSQQLLFPVQVGFSRPVLERFEEVADVLRRAGFVIEPLGQDHLVVYAHPPELPVTQLPSVIEEFLTTDETSGGAGAADERRQRHSVRLSVLMARAAGPCLSPEQAEATLALLFSCSEPSRSPGGQPCFRKLDERDLLKFLNEA